MLRQSVAGMIRSITTFAAAQGDPAAVYAAAQIPPPQAAGPASPPASHQRHGDPRRRGERHPQVEVREPPGGNVVYSISRREDSTGTFAQVGVSGARSFTMTTSPRARPASSTPSGLPRPDRRPRLGHLHASVRARGGLAFGKAKLTLENSSTSAHPGKCAGAPEVAGAPFLIWGGGGRRDGFATLRGPLLPSPP